MKGNAAEAGTLAERIFKTRNPRAVHTGGPIDFAINGRWAEVKSCKASTGRATLIGFHQSEVDKLRPYLGTRTVDIALVDTDTEKITIIPLEDFWPCIEGGRVQYNISISARMARSWEWD